MKILVYGAGVLGCNLARNLLRAGKDVTLLGRGAGGRGGTRAAGGGERLFSPPSSVSRIPVVTELAPDAMYDVIFVVLRYTQLDSVLDTLRANRTRTSFLWGTMCRRGRWRRHCRKKNVLFAFALSAGHREVDRVVSIDLKRSPSGS